MAGPARPRRTKRQELTNALGPAAARRRHALGLAQRDLALLAEVSERSVQALEAGKFTMRADIMLKVLDALGLTLAVMPKSHGRRLADNDDVVLLTTQQFQQRPPKGSSATTSPTGQRTQ